MRVRSPCRGVRLLAQFRAADTGAREIGIVPVADRVVGAERQSLSPAGLGQFLHHAADAHSGLHRADTGFPARGLPDAGATLHRWQEEVACLRRFTCSNGMTGSFLTKMEMISRRAFGFRNFQNYRLRVRVLCA